MSVTEVKAFKTSDDVLFPEKYLADRHQVRIDFEEWYSQNKLAYSIEADEVFGYILTNREVIRLILEKT